MMHILNGRDGQTRPLIANLSINLPFGGDFEVHRDGEVDSRARSWALANGYARIEGVPACAHGLHGYTTCALDPCRNYESRWLEHASVWCAPGPRAIPFVLSHPFLRDIPDEAKAYAYAHGLTIESWDTDRWYTRNTTPIRLTPAGINFWSSPLEDSLVRILEDHPRIAWPAVPPFAPVDKADQANYR